MFAVQIPSHCIQLLQEVHINKFQFWVTAFDVPAKKKI